MQKKTKSKNILFVTVLLFFLGVIGVARGNKRPFDGNEIMENIMKTVFLDLFGEKIYELEASTKEDGWLWLNEILGIGDYFHGVYYVECSNVGQEQADKIKEENEKAMAASNEEFIVEKEGKVEKIKEEKQEITIKDTEASNALVEQLKKKQSATFLLKNFYIVDATTSVDKSVFDVEAFLKRDFSIEKKEKPQILIFHTHGGSEYFVDGKNEEGSVIGTGTHLAKILEEEYGYKVIHDKTKYDFVNGKLDRNKAYTQACEGVTKILEENPSIEVVIDLHRDGVNSDLRRVTKIDGKETAQFMIFNGMSRNQNGEIAYLKNPNLQDNLAFGLQVKLRAMELYPELTIRNYLKGYRYNMHLKERFLLIELGNENSTVNEAKNTMTYLAEILNDVLQGNTTYSSAED